jgi:hypothetical protein
MDPSKITGQVTSLKEIFPKADPKFRDCFEQIRALLQDSKQVQAWLVKLNNIMQEENLSLEKVLSKTEEENGFQNVVSIKELLEVPVFMAHTSEGYPLFDPGAGLKHGPNTHRIQWWVVIQEMKAHPEKYDKVSPIDLYKSTGGKEFRYKFKVREDLEKPRTVWDTVFDRTISDGMTFRASFPEWFHPQLLNLGEHTYGQKQILNVEAFPSLHQDLKKTFDTYSEIKVDDIKKEREPDSTHWLKPSEIFSKLAEETPYGKYNNSSSEWEGTNDRKGSFKNQIERQNDYSQSAQMVTIDTQDILPEEGFLTSL